MYQCTKCLLFESIRGCSYVKSELAPVQVSFRYDSDFVPVLHEGMRFYCTFTWRALHVGRHDCDAILDWIENYACAIHSRLPGEWFHVETNSRTSFTRHRNELSYRNENLPSVQLPGWTRTVMTRSGQMRFCASIICKLNEHRAIRGNRSTSEPVLEWKLWRSHACKHPSS